MNKKKAQQLLPIVKNKETFLKNVADAVPALVVVYNIKTGEYIYVNKAVKKLLYYSPEEFINGGFAFVTSIVHPKDFSRIMEENAAALQMANSNDHGPDDEPIVNFEYRMKHKNGKWVWLHTDASVYARDDEGSVEYVLNVSLDITRRKEAESQVKKFAAEREKYATTLTENIADAVIVTDIDYNVTGWNKAAEKIYGWKAEEVIGKNSRQFLYTEFVDSSSSERWHEALPKYGYWKGEVIQSRKDGTTVPILASVAYVKDDTGNVIGAVAVNRDITYQKEQEKNKDDFIALAAHEMKTPVTSLKIFNQYIQQSLQKKGDLEFVNYMRRMDKQLTRLTKLINDLLDASRVKKEKLDYKKENFSIDHLIEETVETMQRITDTHKIIFDEKAKKIVFADPDRIEQVLLNLISNAVKYSPKADTVRVGATVEGKNLKVYVQDYGIGIPKIEREVIFERFYQVDDPERKTYPGLGLGLYISSQIIARHNGKLWVESELGKGSTFFFSIPLKRKEK